MQAIGQSWCTGLTSDNICLETNKNTTFPVHNDTSGVPASIDVNWNGDVIGSGGDSGSATSSAGFIVAVPILSSFFLTFGAAGIAALSIMLWYIFGQVVTYIQFFCGMVWWLVRWTFSST